MKKQLLLVLNGKGGVGKSFFAVNFVQYLKDRQITHAAFDSDNENSTLKRFHPEAVFLNLADPRGLDPMIQELEASPASTSSRTRSFATSRNGAAFASTKRAFIGKH